MIRITTIAATAAFAIATVGALPAAAQNVRPGARTVSATLACVKDLKSAYCGRQQDALLRGVAQRHGGRQDALTVQEIGRRQIEGLIDSVG